MKAWIQAELQKVPSTFFQRFIYTAAIAAGGYLLFHFRDHLEDIIMLPFWLFALLFCGACAAVSIGAIALLRSFRIPKWTRFIRAQIDGTVWKWKWTEEQVSDLTPYCADCGSEVEFRDNSHGIGYSISQLATFCPICNTNKVEYRGVSDVKEQTRKKIIHARDSGFWISLKKG